MFYLPSVSRKYAAVIQEIRSLPIQNIPAVPEWKAFIPKQENEWEEPLSKREREIAELAARGLRNGEIAEMLHISEGTVKNHELMTKAISDVDDCVEGMRKFMRPSIHSRAFGCLGATSRMSHT